MQINSTSGVIIPTQALKTGNTLPTNKAQYSQPTQAKTTIRELAQSIDPSNMSRNDARAIADALMRSGEGDLSATFMAQSLVLKENPDGSLSNPSSDDPIMNEKFNMFDSLRSQIEFHKAHSLSTDRLESALSFIEKLKLAKETPEINTYT
jgi:hypothetical protein